MRATQPLPWLYDYSWFVGFAVALGLYVLLMRSSRRAAALALGVTLVALAPAPAAAGEEAQAPQSAGYFSVQPDIRLCPAPDCGGVFVARLNRARTRCADGVEQPLCHASDLDLTRLGLDDAARARFDEALLAGRALLRGRLLPGRRIGDFPLLGRFVATEAWIAASGQEPSGRFYRVSDLGIVCVTTPCFSLRQRLLNSGKERDLSGLDLTESGASDEAIEDALAALGSAPILVAGRDRVHHDAGAGGPAIDLVAAQFYRRLPAAQ